MRAMFVLCGVFALATLAGSAVAQERSTGGTVTLTKAQYQSLIDAQKKLEAEVKALSAKVDQSAKQAAQSPTDQQLDDLERQIAEAKAIAKDSYSGSTKFLVSGYGSSNYSDYAHQDGTKAFDASFNPMFLWKVSDRLMFEGELEAQLEDSDTTIALEMAQSSYLINEYATIGAGKFLNPADYFVQYQHMNWVNKLPDKPLAVYDGLFPETNVGAQLHGVIPAGPTRVTYSVYASNAPLLDEDSGSGTSQGTLEFDNFSNTGNNLAVGGRVGFQPVYGLDIGYGVQSASVSETQSVHSLLQSVDFSYVRDSDTIAGIINLKGQWVWSHVGDATYDDGLGGTLPSFNNRRDGGYAQIAYRPSHLDNEFFSSLEAVYRYDVLNQRDTPTGVDECRNTFGINYWLSPSAVLKGAYQFDHQSGPEADARNAILAQFALGF